MSIPDPLESPTPAAATAHVFPKGDGDTETTVKQHLKSWQDKVWGQLTYLRLHVLYFVILIFVGSGLLYCSVDQPLPYVDALFMSASAATLSGLASVPMEDMTTYQHAVLFVVMVLGSVLWVSQYAVWMRLTYFNRALKFVEENFDHIMHSLERTIHPAIPNQVSDWVEKDTKLTPPGWPFNFDKLVDTVDSRVASRKNSMYSRTSSVYPRNNSIYSRSNSIFGPFGGIPRSNSLSVALPRTDSSFSRMSTVKVPRLSLSLDPSVYDEYVDEHTDGNADNFGGHFSHPFGREDSYELPMSILHASSSPAPPQSLLKTDQTVQTIPSPQTPKLQSILNTDQTGFDPTLRVKIDTPSVQSADQGTATPFPRTLTMTDQVIPQQGILRTTTIDSTKMGLLPSEEGLRRRIKFTDSAGNDLPQNLQGAIHPIFLQPTETLSSNEMSPTPVRMSNEEYQRRMSTFSTVFKARSLHAVPERDALRLLCVLIPAYMLAWVLGCSAICWIWLGVNQDYQIFLRSILAEGEGPVDPWWFTFFFCTSAFVNCGLNIISVGASIFKTGSGPFLYVAIGLILAGNTLSPVFLRFTVRIFRWIESTRLGRKEGFNWTRGVDVDDSHGFKRTSRFLDACDFLLEHPRRVYTVMFPGSHTRWILIINLLLTFVGFFFFIGFEWNLYGALGLPYRGWDYFLGGFFTEVNVRSSGMNVYNLSLFNPAMWIYFVFAMYVSVIPIALARKRTNVYVDRELDQQPERGEMKVLPDGTVVFVPMQKKRKTMDGFVVNQLKSQVFSEMAVVLLAIFLIVAVETYYGYFATREYVFAIIFEVVSAFGNVGLSLGHPNSAVSFALVLSPVSKVILVLVMFVGRHRGLPSKIDKSVNIPGLAELEEGGGLWLAMSNGEEPD
jgi:Trk-type K+ transport system membrane component